MRKEEVAAGAEKALSGRFWGAITVADLDRAAERLIMMLQRLHSETVLLKGGGRGLRHMRWWNEKTAISTAALRKAERTWRITRQEKH